MAKIIKSIVANIKSIEKFEIEPQGKTVFIFGGNGKGKTTFIRFLYDRLTENKFLSPQVLNDNSKNGYATIVLDDKSEFSVEINPDGKEKLIYKTPEGIKIKASKDIIHKYFSKRFDIDKFLNYTPKEKVSYLTKLFNINIDELIKKKNELISERRIWFNILSEKKAIYDNTPQPSKNNLSELLKEKNAIIEEYNKKLQEVDEENNRRRKEQEKIANEYLIKAMKFNEEQDRLQHSREQLKQIIVSLSNITNIINVDNEINMLKEKLKNVPDPKPHMNLTMPKEKIGALELLPKPTLDTSDIDAKIMEAQNSLSIEEYEKIKEDYLNAENTYKNIDKNVKDIEQQIKNTLATLDIHEDITIDTDNVYYKKRILDYEYQSTSELYIAALIIGAYTLRELKFMHFDASPLDKVSLKKVIDFAKVNDLQLFIEKPDDEGGELTWQCIEF